MRTSWLGLLLTLGALLPTVGQAQQQRSAWVSWNLPKLGAAVPAAALTTVPDSIRVRSGYQHWRGAGLGAAFGGGLGVLAGAIAGGITSCDDCSEQPTAGKGALYGGLVGAGVGGVLGFLVGLSSPRYLWVPASEQPR